MPPPVHVRLSELRMAIQQTLGCEAENIAEVVHVRAPRDRGKTCDGMVHILEISGHPKATRCYAWPEPLNATTVIIRTVLHSDKISSPQEAVRSVINRRRHA